MKTGKDFFIDTDVTIKCKDTSVFGNHSAVDKGFYCTTELNIGDYVHIGPYVVVIGSSKSKMIFEDFSFAATGTKIIAGSDDYTASSLMGPVIPDEFKVLNLSTIRFKKYSGCGANCVIMPGVTLGEGSVVGVGSVVSKDTLPWTIYAGYPARPIGKRDEKKVKEQARALGYE